MVIIHKPDFGRITCRLSFSGLKTAQFPCFVESTAGEFVKILTDSLGKPAFRNFIKGIHIPCTVGSIVVIQVGGKCLPPQLADVSRVESRWD